MIKATKLSNQLIETKTTGQIVTDKDFFYNHAGFSVRKQQLGLMAAVASNRDQPQHQLDEEAVLYIPLLTRQQLRDRMEQRNLVEELSCPGWPTKKGARICVRCKKIAVGLRRCSRCAVVYYCDQTCQRKDWKTHKTVCGVGHQEI